MSRATKILDIHEESRQISITVEDSAAALAVSPTEEIVNLNLDEIFEVYVVGKAVAIPAVGAGIPSLV